MLKSIAGIDRIGTGRIDPGKRLLDLGPLDGVDEELRRLGDPDGVSQEIGQQPAVDKPDFQERQSRLETETTDAKRLLAAAQISHEGVLAVVDTCVKLLQYAGVLYRQMPDDNRQTFNQARYDAIYIDTDDSGAPIVTRTDIVPILAEVESVVRPHVSPVGSQAEKAREQARRASYHHAATSGRRDGTRHGADVENRRRSEQNPRHLNDDLGSNLTNLAEREGFEPSDPCGSPVFKTGAFVRSATAPPGSVGEQTTQSTPRKAGKRAGTAVYDLSHTWRGAGVRPNGPPC